jgi:hypothetical protein
MTKMGIKKTTKKRLKEVAVFAASGAATGVGVSSTVGRMGLAVAGTAFSIGGTTLAITGTVVGLAAYGLKKAISK